jgi:hypothetical protein
MKKSIAIFILTLAFIASAVTAAFAGKTSPCYNNGMGFKLTYGHEKTVGNRHFSKTPYADNYKPKKQHYHNYYK